MWESRFAAVADLHHLTAEARADLLACLKEAIAAPYEDLGPIGAGAMGEVRRVRDPRLNRVVAMKVIRPELLARPTSVARFLDEAQLGAQLQHPAITPVHDVGQLSD